MDWCGGLSTKSPVNFSASCFVVILHHVTCDCHVMSSEQRPRTRQLRSQWADTSSVICVLTCINSDMVRSECISLLHCSWVHCMLPKLLTDQQVEQCSMCWLKFSYSREGEKLEIWRPVDIRTPSEVTLILVTPTLHSECLWRRASKQSFYQTQ